MTTKSKSVFFAAALAIAFASCAKSEGAADPQPKAAEPAAKAQPDDKPAANDRGEREVAAVAEVMKPYESCRALLAADKVEGIADCAKAVSESAKAAVEQASDAAKEPLAAVASAADKLATGPTDDIEAVRMAFGHLSEATVALLTAVPAAAASYHVFECPMAKGYKRWAQTDAELANPYMGSRMLGCGQEVHDHHQGMAH